MNQANTEGQKITFNSRELQNEFDLFVVAMDFRQYDPALGRFTAMDLLTEKYLSFTPYQFGNNNPVYWADPSGLSSVSSEFSHDFMGRERFDRFGMFIIPNDRQYRSITAADSNFGGGGFGSFDDYDLNVSRTILELLRKHGIEKISYDSKSKKWTVLVKTFEGNSNSSKVDGVILLGGATVGYEKIIIHGGGGSSWDGNNNLSQNFASGFTSTFLWALSDRSEWLSQNYNTSYGSKTQSATQITNNVRSHYFKLARYAKGGGALFGFVSGGFSLNKAYNDYSSGKGVDGWDVADGVIGITGSVATVGTILLSNPVGWGIIATGATIYGVVRLGMFIYDASTN